MKKLYFALFITLFCLVIQAVYTHSVSEETVTDIDSKKLTVVATLFPQYDFAREIAGDKADIYLLLPPGMESHSYEPTPGDILSIHNSDIFLYTGDEMEPWVSGIVDNMKEVDQDISSESHHFPVIANLSTGIEFHMEEHNHVHEEEPCTDETHDHEDGYIHSDTSHDAASCMEETHNHAIDSVMEEALIIGEHTHKYNPHIWTSPVLAMTMVQNVVNAFIEADPSNASYYEANGETYLEKLAELDRHFRDIVEKADFDTIYVGSKFSLLYFMEEYGLHYVAAYDSCEEEAEPSIKRVVSMIKSMKESGIRAVYYQELIEPYIANTIAEAAGAETYLFHSCHNVSKEDLEAGVTYLSLMEQNASNLEKGLYR